MYIIDDGIDCVIRKDGTSRGPESGWDIVSCTGHLLWIHRGTRVKPQSQCLWFDLQIHHDGDECDGNKTLGQIQFNSKITLT